MLSPHVHNNCINATPAARTTVQMANAVRELAELCVDEDIGADIGAEEDARICELVGVDELRELAGAEEETATLANDELPD